MLPVVAEIVGVAERGIACGRERLLKGVLVGRQGIQPEVWGRQAPAVRCASKL
jgi:hypothetical protein